MFWTVGGSRSTWRKPTQAQGEHTNSTQKHPDPESNPGPSCCEVTVLTTVHQGFNLPFNFPKSKGTFMVFNRTMEGDD